ncbi:MAD2L1-binding protein-like [Lytechinus pictus]|uniref:MAD2L1-binding protein-like n=1 Tax=Lytechinus pictus TaxID=7653 RepID=UPI0030BA0F80
MATKCEKESTCRISLNGFVTQNIKSRIVTEILKYLLYHREQIPLPFDQLYFQYQRPEINEADHKHTLFKKRMTQLLKESQELFVNIDSLFQETDISHIIVLFGSTVISPKEVYHIRFLNNEQTSQTLSVKHCVRSVARSLITSSPLGDSPLPPVTNMVLTAHAPRSCNPTWFKPKANFKVPKMGRHCNIDISCGMMHSRVSSEEHIWMQTPSGIKGLKDTVSPKAPSDLWCS